VSRSDRDPYAKVGAAMRDTIRRANAARLTVLQHRVLAAVLALTAGFSRIEDRVWLDQVCALAYGVEESQEWMRKKVSKALRLLEAAGLIVRRAPRGRPPGGRGPAYVVGLHTPEKGPDPGPTSEETGPDPGPTSERGKGARSWSEKGPDPGPKRGPGSGGPTEKASEKKTEGVVPGPVSGNGTSSAATAAPAPQQSTQEGPMSFVAPEPHYVAGLPATTPSAGAFPGPPSRRCQEHADWPPDRPVPPCGPCADARRAHDAYQRAAPPARPHPLDDQQAAERARALRPRCLECSGTGQVLPEDLIPRPCPTCNPQGDVPGDR
jgi:hypothetical protein